ncbi:MAG: nucleotidyltransferase family protein [Rhodobacteraceae bacterium]|jgi:CTP:molybdopterin cytidylyltransferase MocA|nr:nucleotidyltransferase family protein [Paracoccaceae bacterium]
MTPPPTLILIPAAGSSSRMRGADKLLEQVDGTPQLARAAQAALASGCAVAVTLRPDDTARAAALAGLAITVIPVPDAATGMSASLRRGAAACPPGHALMILPADMPDIGPDDLSAMLAAQSRHPDRILRATGQDGRPGNPVLFPPRLVPRFADLTGDEGARRLLSGESLVPVVLPMRRALTDLDTPEDWATWRAMRNSPAAR